MCSEFCVLITDYFLMQLIFSKNMRDYSNLIVSFLRDSIYLIKTDDTLAKKWIEIDLIPLIETHFTNTFTSEKSQGNFIQDLLIEEFINILMRFQNLTNISFPIDPKLLTKEKIEISIRTRHTNYLDSEEARSLIDSVALTFTDITAKEENIKKIDLAKNILNKALWINSIDFRSIFNMSLLYYYMHCLKEKGNNTTYLDTAKKLSKTGNRK